MVFGKKKKAEKEKAVKEKAVKEKSFEKKFSELDATVLSGKDLKNARKIEQYVVERLEQMIELTQEIEEEKAEYRVVTSYLNDIQLLEDMPEDEREGINEVAANVVQLNTARTEYLNSAKKISDAQFAQMEKVEREIPDAIKRLSANELYQDTLKRDLKYLDREKSEWVLRGEYLGHQRTMLKYALYIMVGIAATAAVLLGILQLILEQDFFYGWMALIFVTAVTICGIFLKIQSDGSEIAAAERSRNRAIVLENKVKIKYVNIANAVEYACEKYHVHNSVELQQQWEYYLEAVREREKYERTNEDLEYFNGRLVRLLSNYHFYDAKIWISQAAALLNAKEMVEIKHDLVVRRQKLRSQIEYNLGVIKEQKKATEQLLDRVGDMRPQVEKILIAIDRMEEA